MTSFASMMPLAEKAGTRDRRRPARAARPGRTGNRLGQIGSLQRGRRVAVTTCSASRRAASWSGATVERADARIRRSALRSARSKSFRAYESPADSFRDYAKLIRNNPRYENAVGTGTDVASFAAALQKGGYATDPNYASKIVAVANDVRGTPCGGAGPAGQCHVGLLSER